MAYKSYNNNKQFQQEEKPLVFNDALDVFNPNFSVRDKILGLTSLPFNPLLHPIQTVKGVFETYSKVATIPLAVYSGNLDRVKGIIQGTDDFSGHDVVNQMAGGELHGILPSLAGFGLDIAADPFVGIAKLPREVAMAGNSLITQAAAPGFAQALNHFGVISKAQRFAGTGSGTANDIVAKSTDALKKGDHAAFHDLAVQEEATIEANRQLAELHGQGKVRYPLVQPLEDGSHTLIASDVIDALPAEAKNIPGVAEDFIQQSENQLDHAANAKKMEDIVKYLTPDALSAELKSTIYSREEELGIVENYIKHAIAQVGGDIEKAKMLDPKTFEAYNELQKASLVTKGVGPGFNLTNILDRFTESENVLEAHRMLKDVVTAEYGRVIAKHSKLKLHKVTGGFIAETDDLVLANGTDAIKKSQWKQKYKKYNSYKSPVSLKDAAVDYLTDLSKNTKLADLKGKKLVGTSILDELISSWDLELSDEANKFLKATMQSSIKTSIVDFEQTLLNETPEIQKELRKVIANKKLELYDALVEAFGKEEAGDDYSIAAAEAVLFDSLQSMSLVSLFDSVESSTTKAVTGKEPAEVMEFINSISKPDQELLELGDLEAMNKLIKTMYDKSPLSKLHKFENLATEAPEVYQKVINFTEEFLHTPDDYLKHLTALQNELGIADVPANNIRGLSTDLNDIINGAGRAFTQEVPPSVGTKDPFFTAKQKGFLEVQPDGSYKATRKFWMPQGIRNDFKNKLIFNKKGIREMLNFLRQETPYGVTNLVKLSNDHPEVYQAMVNFMHEATHNPVNAQKSWIELKQILGIERITDEFEAAVSDATFEGETRLIDSTDQLVGSANISGAGVNESLVDSKLKHLTYLDSVQEWLQNTDMYDLAESGSYRAILNHMDAMLPSFTEVRPAKGFESTISGTFIPKDTIITPKELVTHNTKIKVNSAKGKVPLSKAKFGYLTSYQNVMAKLDKSSELYKAILEAAKVSPDVLPWEISLEEYEALGDVVRPIKRTFDYYARAMQHKLGSDSPAAKLRIEEMYRAFIPQQVEAEIEEMIPELTDFESQDEVLIETNRKDFKAAEMNLGAEQLSMFIGVREGTAKPFARAQSKLANTQSNLKTSAMAIAGGDVKKARKMVAVINDSAIRSLYKNHKIEIKGADFGMDLLRKNLVMVVDKNQHKGVAEMFEHWADTLNDQIGEKIFSVHQHAKPQAHLISLKPTIAHGDSEAWEKLKTWMEANINGSTGFRDLTLHSPAKQKAVNPTLAPYREAVIQSMKDANAELHDALSFAGLGDQVKWGVDEYFPHVQQGIDGVVFEEKLVDTHALALAAQLKRELKISGAFSSVAQDRSVLGTPFDTRINVNGKSQSLFTTNILNAYQNAFATSFAEHEQLRIAREVIFTPQFALKNLELIHIPETAVADFDILIPVRDNKGGLQKIKSYSPTPANIERFKDSGFLSSKVVSSEARSLMKYQNIVAKAPAYEWLSKNFTSGFKRGVLLNLAFPIGNAGDMAFKTFAGNEFKELPKQVQSIAASSYVFTSHESAMRQYALLRTSELGHFLYDVPPIRFITDTIKYLEKGTAAKWMQGLYKNGSNFMLKLEAMKGDKDQIHKMYNALAFERYSSLPVSTTAQKQTYIEEAVVKKRYKAGSQREQELEEYKEWLNSESEHPIGKFINKITTRNSIARKIANFNERLENQMRFAQLAMDLDFSQEGIRDTLKDKDAIYAATQAIKWNHMHFSEMPGEAVWATAIWPFFQFPVKNAMWWFKFLSKRPDLAAQVDSFRKEIWSDADADSFWAKLGGMPIGDHTIFKGVPGLGSLSTFGMAVDTPTDLMGNRLNPILRPFLSDNGKKYRSYSLADRTPHSDNMIAALLHGMNPLEGNVQATLNFINQPSLAGMAPSVLKENKDFSKDKEKFTKK